MPPLELDWLLSVLVVALVAAAAYWIARRPRRRTVVQPNPPSVPVSTGPAKVAAAPATSALPKVSYDEDEELDTTKLADLSAPRAPLTTRIVYDEDAAIDEPTHPEALILITAIGQTDKGVRRQRNEDRVLVREDEGLFVVADGMGGYRGGELASELAVRTIEQAFVTHSFGAESQESMPRRASELAHAIQMANDAILAHASTDKQLDGMGTTVCAARFSRSKQRLYVGHVGDSRVYRLRDGRLEQMTSDHTMKSFGLSGPTAAHLSRAVGIWPTVPIDVIIGTPRVGDVYLLCSDGLTKMVSDGEIEETLRESDPQTAVERLIARANDLGGKDNIAIIVVRVDAPKRAPNGNESRAA